MPSTFNDYALAGFTSELLPIIPPRVPLSPESTVKETGKVPGVRTPDGWVGLLGWTERTSTNDDLLAWQNSGAGIGLQGRVYPALDIDVDDWELADAIELLALKALGPAPVRSAGQARRLLPYAGGGMRKMRLAFQTRDGVCYAVEWLATGQFYVVDAIHPKHGRPYEWRDGHCPARLGAGQLTVLDEGKVRAFWSDLKSLLEGKGCVVRSSSTEHSVRQRAGVWQEGLLAPSVASIQRALAALPNDVDYDTWLRVGVAVKAAAGPEREVEGYAIWEDWSLQYGGNTPNVIEAKWTSFQPPFTIGWDYLARLCTNEGDGSFFGAHEDFDAVADAPTDGGERERPLTAMFGRYVWVEAVQRVADTKTGELLNREQFNVRNRHIGPPSDARKCAYAVFLSDTSRLKTVKGLTYRPGAPEFVHESLPGLTGECFNQWRDPKPNLPPHATDEDAAAWLKHVAFVVPDEREREIVLNWLAWVLQNPGEKPNWSILIGSTYEGLGKDMMLEPVRIALGADNVREIGPSDLGSNYTWFLARTRLLIVEEMHSFERKETANRLKPLIAAPPYTLTVNIKHNPQYEVPNGLAAIFFTNMPNALPVSAHDRRFFMTWNDGAPRESTYYENLHTWYATGGAGIAARWLLDRDVSGFHAKGKAPPSIAKEGMRKASRAAWEAIVEDAAKDADGPFTYRVVALDEVENWVKLEVGDRGRSNRPLAALLKRMGFIEVHRCDLGDRPERLGGGRPPGPRLKRLYALRGDLLTMGEPDLTTLREAYWADRDLHSEVQCGGGHSRC